MKFTYLILLSVFSVSFCHGQDSYTPSKMIKTLGSFTKSKILLQSEISDLIDSKKCKYLTKNRSYGAPVGLFAKNDIKNAAKGIDEWIEMDKGNSYVLTNYKWVPKDVHGSTQLFVEFDSLHCVEEK